MLDISATVCIDSLLWNPVHELRLTDPKEYSVPIPVDKDFYFCLCLVIVVMLKRGALIHFLVSVSE